MLQSAFLGHQSLKFSVLETKKQSSGRFFAFYPDQLSFLKGVSVTSRGTFCQSSSLSAKEFRLCQWLQAIRSIDGRIFVIATQCHLSLVYLSDSSEIVGGVNSPSRNLNGCCRSLKVQILIVKAGSLSSSPNLFGVSSLVVFAAAFTYCPEGSSWPSSSTSCSCLTWPVLFFELPPD